MKQKETAVNSLTGGIAHLFKQNKVGLQHYEIFVANSRNMFFALHMYFRSQKFTVMVEYRRQMK